MIITKNILLTMLKTGEMKIEPFQVDALESVSYNVTLHHQIRVFREGLNEIDIAEVEKNVGVIAELTRVIDIPSGEYYLLKPGELVLGMTVEMITLPFTIAGWLQGRSRFARMGLMVHITASLLQPGIANRQVFEIYNASRNAIKLRAGVKIAQIVFERCEGESQYHGAFSHQQEI